MALFDYDLDDMIENAALSSLFANNANTQLFSTNALNNAFMMEAYEDFYDDMKDYYKIGLLNKQAAQGGMQGLFFIDDWCLFTSGFFARIYLDAARIIYAPTPYTYKYLVSVWICKAPFFLELLFLPLPQASLY